MKPRTWSERLTIGHQAAFTDRLPSDVEAQQGDQANIRLFGRQSATIQFEGRIAHFRGSANAEPPGADGAEEIAIDQAI